mmetsp:Transcript_27313/g.41331  ORF Transcript_27313/g.41331 Transcript_27313/m.41331 type:complete len:1283 (-) Transcript_27313:262-4110(-)|eukprot:CAMPEP_0178907028 /NCGR_PEP_ID=MMETSP0786-20121207/7142_1 /TAXON_ID=186022 /ORGANISM="Thalassionema frauenfeldii, Strain CCMP 1798" /LENGTH=1282 /DNA_ID=CAMNT_0020578779 /DNA_START=169 /DNA_END=4017 /DNA_ORIENTATION=-
MNFSENADQGQRQPEQNRNAALRQYLEQDDDSHCFMSEPSISTDEITGGSNTPRYLLSPHETLSEDEIEFFLERNRASSPPLSNLQQLHQPQHQTIFSSPGNTSLSSKGLSSSGNSPHFQPKVELDFITYEKRSQLKIESTPYGPVLTARPKIVKSEPQNSRGSTMALEATRPENVAPSSRSSSSASSGQQERVTEFLQNLKMQSIGAVEDADSDDFDSDRKPAAADRAEIDAVMRRQEQPHQHYGIEVIDTEPDETIIMTLSESDGEKDTDVDLELLDWEQQHSADDEKTAENQRKIRYLHTSTRKKPYTKNEKGHTRTRSGDDVAAVLMTGSTEWRGMKDHDFPIPCLKNENEFEDSPVSAKELTAQMQIRPQIMKSSQSSGESSGGFVLGTHGKVANTRKTRRPPRQSRQRAHSLSSAGEIQRKHQQAAYSPLLENSLNKRRNFSLNESMSDSSYSIEYSSTEIKHPGAGKTGSFSRKEKPVFQRFPSDSSYDGSHFTSRHPQQRGQTEEIVSPRRSTGFSSVNFQVDLQEKVSKATTGLEGQIKSESEDLTFSSEETLLESLQCNNPKNKLRFNFRKGFEHSPESIFAGRQDAVNQRVLRPNHMDDGTEMNSNGMKKAFQPITNAASSQHNQPTFACPKCGLIQRSFFTASSVPSQDSLGGYLALGFISYVIISLIIFGFEEGWEGLDCFYFAIITLTTAGLGDFVPTTDEGKIICCVFIYFGVACIGLLLGTYIAGMQDENSRKEAMNSRVDNCVRCSTAKTRRESLRSTVLAYSTPRHNAASRLGHLGSSTKPQYYRRGEAAPESPNATIKTSDVQQHHPKRRKYQHNEMATGNIPSSDLQDVYKLDSPLSHSSMSHTEEWPLTSQSNVSQQGSQQSLNVIDTYCSTRALPNSPQSPLAAVLPSSIIGSPMTTQILGRQKHTRHSSFDVRPSNLFHKEDKSQIQSTRADDGVLPTFHFHSDEGMPGYSSMRSVSMPPDTEESDNSSFFSDSDISMEGSKDSKFKTIKYVLLTMKQALVNSIAIISIGSVGFYLIEKMTVVDSFYFTTVLLTTVGYGDLVPETSAGKLFATCYLLIGGTVLLNNMSLISMIPLELRKRRIEKAVLTQFGDQLDDAALRELATGPLIQRLRLSMSRSNGLDECTREMFALAMLVRLGKVTERDVHQTFAAFRRLDVDNEGVLNSRTIITGIMHKRKSMKDLRDTIPESPPASPRSESKTLFKSGVSSFPSNGVEQKLGENAPLLDSNSMSQCQFRGGTFSGISHEEKEVVDEEEAVMF